MSNTTSGDGATRQSSAAPRLHHSSVNGAAAPAVQGGFRCICRSFILSSSDVMMECAQCRSWSHAACMEVDALRVKTMRQQNSFVCLFCTGEASRRLHRSNDGRIVVPPPKHSISMQKLSEVPDTRPANARELEASLRRLVQFASCSCGVDIIFVGAGLQGSGSIRTRQLQSSPDAFTDALVEQSLACCASAIDTATFSESYPSWCLSELRSPPHGFLQGTFMRCLRTNKIVSLVLSNGKDGYGGLRGTISRLRTLLRSGGDPSPSKVGGRRVATGAAAAEDLSPFVASCLNIRDVSPFVHINLIATHPSYRGRGLAKMLIAAELLRWALRGRSQVYLNMALDKQLVDGDSRVVLSISPASKRLYDLFDFQPVLPVGRRVNGGGSANDGASEGAASVEGGEFSAKEKDSGRVLANLHFVPTVLRVVATTTAPVGSQACNDDAAATAKDGGANGDQLEDVVLLSPAAPSTAGAGARGRGGRGRGMKRARN